MHVPSISIQSSSCWTIISVRCPGPQASDLNLPQGWETSAGSDTHSIRLTSGVWPITLLRSLFCLKRRMSPSPVAVLHGSVSLGAVALHKVTTSPATARERLSTRQRILAAKTPLSMRTMTKPSRKWWDAVARAAWCNVYSAFRWTSCLTNCHICSKFLCALLLRPNPHNSPPEQTVHSTADQRLFCYFVCPGSG